MRYQRIPSALKLSLYSAILISLCLGCSKCSRSDVKSNAKSDYIRHELSQDDRNLNDIDVPEIGAWQPDLLNIRFIGSDSANGPLTFLFNLPMVDEDSLNLKGHPSIVFEPEVKGIFKWHSPTTLVFTPESGELNYGQQLSMRCDTAVPLQGEAYALPQSWFYDYTVPYFTMAGKMASWPIIKGEPKFVSLLNWRTHEIGNGPVYLLYDQSVKIEDIKKHLTVVSGDDDDKDKMAYTMFRPDNIDMVYDEKVNTSYIIGLKINDLPEHGSTFYVNIPSFQDGSYSTNSYSLTVNKNFEFIKAYINDRWGGEYEIAPLSMSWNIVCSNWFSLEQFKKAISIIPEPKSKRFSSSIYEDYANGYEIQPVGIVDVELEPGTDYTFSVKDDFIDILGNQIKEGYDFNIRSRDLKPILELPKDAVLIEDHVSKIPLRTQNLSNIKADIYKFPSAERFAKALLLGKRSSPSDFGLTKKETTIDVLNENQKSNQVEILDVEIENLPDLLCVNIKANGTGSEAKGSLKDLVLVQHTDFGITTKIFNNKIFVWLTSLSSAKPIEGANVKIYDNKKIIDAGTTNASGVIVLDAKDIISSNFVSQPIAIIVEKLGKSAVAKIENNELSEAWQFGINGIVRGYNPLYASVFTDRGVYRPGETTHLKVIVGNNDIDESNINIKVNDPRGQQILSKDVELDDFNTASIDIKLKEQAGVGEYSIHVSHGNKSIDRFFSVEEYRVPTFQVTVKSDVKKWDLFSNVDATIAAKYMHGGTLDGREVKWMITREPAPYSHKSFPKYIFCYNNGFNYSGTVNSGKKRLDGKGKLNVRFKPDHPTSIGPMRYTIEGTVTDIDRQAYAGRISEIVHPADFYIGLKPPSRNILSIGDILKIPVITVSPDNKIVEGTKVKILLERIDHHTSARLSPSGNVQMQNRPEPVKIHYYEIETHKIPGICEFKFDKAGYYRINAWAEDKKGRTVQSGFEFTVSGDNPIAWPRFDQDKIDLIADKSEYEIGDIAKIVVQSPYQKAQGLMTIERDKIITYKLFEINNNTPEIEIPIESKHAPNIFVSVVILRGRIHNERDASGYETGAPGFKMGYTNIKVNPDDKKLVVNAKVVEKEAIPGQKININLSAKDASSKPVKGQITLMVVDEAVLGLTGYKTPKPLSELYAEHLLGVRTGTSLLDLPHSKRTRLENVFPGGDSDFENMQSRFPQELRNLFKSTAYYNPNILLDDKGQANIELELPDNLTTYRIMAICIDKNYRAGAADEQIVVKQPLMVQPVIPRFVYPDDELEIEAMVYNGTNKSRAVKISSDFEGIKLISGSKNKEVTIKPNSNITVKFPVKALKGNEAVIRFSATDASFSDAVEVKIPILEPGTKRFIVESKSVSGSEDISVTIPAERIASTTNIEVVASTTALTELKGAVQYLMRYPNGCIEQTTSTAYPLVVLKDLLPEIGVEVNMDDLKKFSEAGIRRILSFQTTSGGLSYWPGSDTPHAFATAFGLTALIEAKKKGYDISNDALKGMADYLEASLRQGKISGEMPHGGMADADTRALFVMTLGRLGRPQPGYVSLLWQKRESMTPFGLSFLAIAVKEMPGDQSLLQPILAEIKNAAQTNSKEAWYEGSPQGGWSFDSPLRTHASALLAFASADRTNEMSGKYLTGILERQRGGLWGNTQENVFGIMGVYEASLQKAGGTAPLMELSINQKVYTEDQMEKSSSRVRRLKFVESDLSMTKDEKSKQEVTLTNHGNKPIILTVRVQYDVPLTPENRQEQSNGFVIERKYETLEGKSLERKKIPLGSLVRVKLLLKADAQHHYVAIDDKLPAGLEPLNTSLKTTENVSQGKLSNTAQRSLSVLSYSEIRDSRVAFYVDEMLPGEYEFSYVARATTKGEFLRPAGRVEAMYQPEVFGATAIDYVIIEEK